jgi:hypothetical protein
MDGQEYSSDQDPRLVDFDDRTALTRSKPGLGGAGFAFCVLCLAASTATTGGKTHGQLRTNHGGPHD